jgi:hypothetical protein
LSYPEALEADFDGADVDAAGVGFVVGVSLA